MPLPDHFPDNAANGPVCDNAGFEKTPAAPSNAMQIARRVARKAGRSLFRWRMLLTVFFQLGGLGAIGLTRVDEAANTGIRRLNLDLREDVRAAAPGSDKFAGEGAGVDPFNRAAVPITGRNTRSRASVF
jgi:hypothetical protein